MGQSLIDIPKNTVPAPLTIYSSSPTTDPDELNTVSIGRVSQGLALVTVDKSYVSEGGKWA